MSSFTPLPDASDFNEEIRAVRAIANDVIALMEAATFEPFRGAKDVYPAAWCERASIAIALGLQRNGLKPWTFISMGKPDDLSGHAWLEQAGHEGTEQRLALDATLHQFADWDAPYLGPAPSPAFAVFSVVRFAGPIEEWPVLDRDSTMLGYAQKVVALL